MKKCYSFSLRSQRPGSRAGANVLSELAGLATVATSCVNARYQKSRSNNVINKEFIK